MMELCSKLLTCFNWMFVFALMWCLFSILARDRHSNRGGCGDYWSSVFWNQLGHRSHGQVGSKVTVLELGNRNKCFSINRHWVFLLQYHTPACTQFYLQRTRSHHCSLLTRPDCIYLGFWCTVTCRNLDLLPPVVDLIDNWWCSDHIML